MSKDVGTEVGQRQLISDLEIQNCLWSCRSLSTESLELTLGDYGPHSKI